MANKNIRSLSSRKELEDNLFENIADLSHKNEPKSAFQKLAKRFMIDDSVVVGTASFYDFTRGENRNKKIHEAQFKRGDIVESLKILGDTDKTGTEVTFMPSADTFVNSI